MAHQVGTDLGATHRVVHHVAAAQDLVRRTMIAILALTVVLHLNLADDLVHRQDPAPATATAILVTLARANPDLNPDAAHVHLQAPGQAATTVPETICTLPTKIREVRLQAQTTDGHAATAIGAKAAADETISTMQMDSIRRLRVQTVEVGLGLRGRSRRGLLMSR
jgi:hypothetical protein